MSQLFKNISQIWKGIFQFEKGHSCPFVLNTILSHQSFRVGHLSMAPDSKKMLLYAQIFLAQCQQKITLHSIGFSSKVFRSRETTKCTHQKSYSMLCI